MGIIGLCWFQIMGECSSELECDVEASTPSYNSLIAKREKEHHSNSPG
jgi:hypothetical protein